MTKREAGQIIVILQVSYPDTFKDMSDEALKAMIALWAEMFTEPYEVVAAAVKKYIRTSKDRFMPTPGIITDIIYDCMNDINEVEAWTMVRKACANSLHAEREFKKLPPIVQKAVGSPSQLREWGQMNVEKLNTVVATNFQKTYLNIVKRHIENEKTPPAVKAVLSGMNQKLLNEKNE